MHPTSQVRRSYGGPRRLASAAAVLLLLAFLAACGGDDGGDDDGDGPGGGDSGVTVLTADQAEAVLLSPDNVGPGFEVGENDDDDDSDDLGCLSVIGELDSEEPDAEAEVTYDSTGDVGLPSINQQVASFEDTAALEKTLDAVRDSLDGCTSVSATDDEGTTIELDVSFDEEKSSADADEQLNIAATGMIDAEGMELPFGLHASMTRVDNHVIFLGVADLDTADPGTVDGYTEVAVERLLAVIADEQPTDELVEGPSAGADETPES